MLELGAWTKQAHVEVGTLAARCGLSLLVAVGPSARWIAEGALAAGMEMHQVLMAYDTAEAADAVRALAREGDLVLLKGSRRLQLERILEDFEK
jgi:UDP-N-acetylmuramoyl-tripeptide--D-alanyl-D-alanine ligase